MIIDHHQPDLQHHSTETSSKDRRDFTFVVERSRNGPWPRAWPASADSVTQSQDPPVKDAVSDLCLFSPGGIPCQRTWPAHPRACPPRTCTRTHRTRENGTGFRPLRRAWNGAWGGGARHHRCFLGHAPFSRNSDVTWRLRETVNGGKAVHQF